MVETAVSMRKKNIIFWNFRSESLLLFINILEQIKLNAVFDFLIKKPINNCEIKSELWKVKIERLRNLEVNSKRVKSNGKQIVAAI